MGKVFNFEGPVFTFLSRLADLFWLNLLFIICSLPIVTIGASTTAMYYVTLKMAKDEEGYITKSFFKSFVQNFKQATIIWLIYLVLSAVLVIDLRIANGGSLAGFFDSNAVSNVVIVSVSLMGVLLLITATYVFPILAKFDNTVKNTIKNAFFISIRHLPYTFVMIVLAAVPYVLMWFSPAAYLLIFIMFALLAYINSGFFNKIFVNYMPKEDDESKELISEETLLEGTNGKVGEEIQ